MSKPKFKCTNCNYKGKIHKFIELVLSISYSVRHDHIQGFKEVRCPKCNHSVSIMFDTIKMDAQPNGGSNGG